MSYADLANLVTFRPLERRVDCMAKWAPFRASWSATVDTLAKELRAHGARRAVLEIDMREQDFRNDGLPRANASAATPAVVLSFKATKVPGEPDLRYEVGTYAHWQDNVRAIALGLEALRAVDRYGVTRRGEQYAGWKQLPAGVGSDGDPERGRTLVQAAGDNIKRALHLAHPDHGGQADDFRDVIAYRGQLERG
jgi:hypothetical protein